MSRTRLRCSGGVLATTATINSNSGITAVAFTDIPKPERDGRQEIAPREQEGDRRGHEERDQHVVVTAADDVEHDDRVQPDQRHGEDRAIGAHLRDQPADVAIVPAAEAAASAWYPLMMLVGLRRSPS